MSEITNKTNNLIKYTLTDRASWISHQKELLEKERQAEVEASTNQVEDVSLKQLEAKGIAISKLLVTEISTGLFGRPTVTLAPRQHQGSPGVLPSHTFSSGDIVGIWSTSGGKNAQITSGVVSKLSSSSIQIALDDESPEIEDIPDDEFVRIHKLANDVTYKRIKNGLDELGKVTAGGSGHLIGVLFKETEPYEPLPQVPNKLLTNVGELQIFNKSLDDSQVDAVKFTLTRKDLAVVHGPPGTGKTTTLVEIILQHVKLGCKVFASAPSNLAVDNLLEKLVESKVSVVRVGHPARATLKAQKRSLDALIQCSDEFELIQDIHKDIKATLTSLSKARDKGKRFKLKEEIKNFRKELKEREMRLSKDILSRSEVVLTTLTSAGKSGPLKLLSENHFDLTVIDECSQGLECACYLAAMKAPKLLLAGDHRQLPPTIISTEAAKEGFLVSLMERVIDMYGNQITVMLKTQYRMNSSIMNWASEALYDNQLKAHSSVESHLLCHMKDVCSNEDTENALILIDTAGCNYEEVCGDDLSKGNEGEAAIVSEQVKQLISSGVKESDVAVISPYNLQVDMVRTLLRELHPLVEVRSVDGFQGREKEAIIITLVRSNKQGEIGFLAEDRRLNVAVTRARRQLTLVCDTDTVCRHPFISKLVDHLTVNGVVKSGHEFESEVVASSKNFSFNFGPSESANQHGKKKEIGEKRDKKKDLEKEKEKNEERRKELEKKISDFVKDKTASSLEFPKGLNSYERLLVHEIAEKNGLIHASQGEGTDRFIVLEKRKLEQGTKVDVKPETVMKTEVNVESEREKLESESIGTVKDKCVKERDKELQKQEVDEAVSSDLKEIAPAEVTNKDKSKVKVSKKANKDFINENRKNKTMNGEKKSNRSQIKETPVSSVDSSVKDVKPKVTLKICRICKKEVSVRNYDLHLAKCERLLKEKEIKAEIDKRQTEIKGVKKKHPKNKTEEEDDGGDDFKLMEKYAKENNSCAFPRCKNPSIILLQLCSFCRNNFCLKHHQAEIHGCGEEARKHARTVLTKSVRNGVLTPGSIVPSKKPDPVKRGQLRRKLDKKLGDMEEDRKNKKKGK